MPSPAYAYRLGWRSLKRVVPSLTDAEAKQLALALGESMARYGITTVRRATMFIAQICHESGGFHYREEIASGAEYEGRHDLGNVHPGDGRRYKGRGFIQITGRANYDAIGKAFKKDFLSMPGMLAEPQYAARSAAWWWSTNGCNQIADTGSFVNVTKRINGGTNGLGARRAYLAKCLLVAPFLVPKRRKP